MKLNSRGKWVVAALACLVAQVASAVTASPTSVTLAAGASQTVKVAKVSGTLSASSTQPTVVGVTRISATSYRINALAAGTGEIQFKDRKSMARVRVTVTSAAAEVLAGRLLASNCFQCHGTNGSGGFEKLAGKSANSIYEELREFASGKEDANGIMAAHAMGFSDAQLKSIATYFASVR
jgi:cytochrome subunit of sulfide dehydrogenase